MRNEKRDPNIWRDLPPLSDGYIPAVPRKYSLCVDSPNGYCEIPVTIDLNSIPRVCAGRTYYEVSATCADHLWAACHTLVKLSDLQDLS